MLNAEIVWIWESNRKCAKSLGSMLIAEKVWGKLLKVEKVWESFLKAEEIC